MDPSDTPPSETAKQRSWLSFSLAKLFFTVILLTSLGGNLFSSIQFQNAQNQISILKATQRAQKLEIQSYRNQLGLLSVDDPTKTHVLQLENNSDGRWGWKIYVPEGVQYQLNISQGDIPESGLREPDTHVTIPSGVTTVKLSVINKKSDGWKMESQTSTETLAGKVTSRSSGTFASAYPLNWHPTYLNSANESICPDGLQTVLPDTKPAVLLRQRQWLGHSRNDPDLDKSQPSDGILFWLEPIDKQDAPQVPAKLDNRPEVVPGNPFG